MAVDLPPPIPPQEVSVAEAQTGQAGATITFQSYQIHVYGAPVLGQAELTHAVAGADSLSNAVRAIASACYAAGYPAARVAYALNGNDLYLLVNLDGISRVDAPAPYDSYFKGLAGRTPLTDGALEPRRALASIHADRAGVAATPLLKPEAGGEVFELRPSDSGPDPTQVRVEFGNPGNRFVGRYFVDVDLRTGTRWGDELRAVTREGLRGLNSRPSEGEYFEQNLGWNRVTTLGIFGAGGRYLDYNLHTAPGQDHGVLWIGEAYWLYPLMADFHSRLNTELKVDRTDKSTDSENFALGASTPSQREAYTSVEASASYSRTLELFGRLDVDAGFAVRKGLGQRTAPLTAANMDYLLYRPAIRVKHYFTDSLTVGLDLSGQYSRDTVPEQQQWVLGGINNMATVLPGTTVGDRGYLARLIGELGDYHFMTLRVRPRLFAEYGSSRLEAFSGSPALADVGADVTVQVLPWLEGTVTYAQKVADKDLSDALLDAEDANVFFRAQARF